MNPNRKSLEKWSPHGQLISRLFERNFETRSPLFFHSSSQSLYFAYTWNGESSIFKLHINSSRPTQVIIFNKTEIDAYGWRFGGGCGGIYVNSIDEIFIFSTYNGKLTKWTANKTRGILVADGRRCDSITSTSYSFQQAVIDEKNDLIYILDGTAIFDPVANEIFSNDEIKYLDIRSIVVICYPRDCSD